MPTLQIGFFSPFILRLFSCVFGTVLKSIVQAKSPVTADIDLRLCRYFKLSEGYFLRLQNDYELMEAKRKLGEALN